MLLTIFSAAVTWGTRADAEEAEAVQKVVELNKKALAAYANLDVEEATKLLKQALEICGTSHLDDHLVAARTRVHIGVVYVAGLKQRDQGMEEFKKALRIDPTIKITKGMLNPEVQSAFAEATMDVLEGGEGEVPPPAAAEAKPESAPPAEPAPPPARPAQPASSVGSAIVHTPVTDSAAGQPIVIQAQVPASLAAERVLLAYRPDGVSDFVTHEMDAIEGSTDAYQAQIPAEAASGASVAYYLQAQDAQGQLLAQNGDAADPYIVTLGAKTASGGIINGVTAENETSNEEEGGEGGEGASYWFALALGSGGGFHSGTPEANRTNDNRVPLKNSGFAGALAFQISPEIGYFVSDSLLLSLQGRFQIVTGGTQIHGSAVTNSTNACKGGICHPAAYALAGLAKLTWFIGEPKRVTPFLSLAAGAGQIRHVVNIGNKNLSGCPSSGCQDTVVGGPVLFGPGGGITVELTDSFLIVASTNALVGAPHFMFNFDLNVGLAYVR
ncbi:MAG TPA: tetratricopeptide repeat protein [Polyangia bacterium]|nr:tetratricopeptide repeat protein [Polyangia bacterium]